MNMQFCQKTIDILSLFMNALSESALQPKTALEKFSLGSQTKFLCSRFKS